LKRRGLGQPGVPYQTGLPRPWLMPLVPLYWAGLRLKDALRRVGILKTRRLAWPVISVGSLSAGGAGKTPVVIALAELLHVRGWTVDVLSRGYGREGTGVERVVPDAEGAAARFGDEPVLIAQRTGVPVWLGAERFAAGEAAERAIEEQPFDIERPDHRAAVEERCVHLLDDGFQHRQLARTMDVVLVTAEDLDDALLPAGNRREPLATLARADAVVVREEERESVAPRISGLMKPGAGVWVVRREVVFPEGAVLQSAVPTYGHIVFSAIARPENFLQMLRDAKVHELEVVTFPDHYAYTAEDIRRLVEICDLAIGNGFMTTEKDAVKLSPDLRSQLEAVGPLVVVRLQSLFVDTDAVVQALEARIG
jgi:tetraacyldisaccharide 4'-kinase